MALALASGLTLALALACGPSERSDEDACVEADLACSPIVSPPTFDAIYDNILYPSCASGTGSCHGPAVAGGLDMRTPDAAFTGMQARSLPDDVGCSLVMKRVDSNDRARRMPPGPNPLSKEQRCAIRQWIANGAQR